MAPGVMEALTMAEARSCHPDMYVKMQLQRNKAKSLRPIIELDENDGETVTNYDDDLSVFSSSIIPVQNKMDRLLKIVKNDLESRTAQEQEIRQYCKVHLDKAKVRYETKNCKGAVLSMRTIKRLEAEQERLLKAIAYLRRLEIDLEIPSEGGVDTAYFLTNLDRDVEKILKPPVKETIPRDDDLMSELAAIVAGRQRSGV